MDPTLDSEQQTLVFRLQPGTSLALWKLDQPTIANIIGPVPSKISAQLLKLPVRKLTTLADSLIDRLLSRANGGKCSSCVLVDPRDYGLVDVSARMVPALERALQDAVVTTYRAMGTGWSPPPVTLSPPQKRVDQGYRKPPRAAPLASATALQARQHRWGVNANRVEKLAAGRGELIGLHLIDTGWNLQTMTFASTSISYASHQAITRPCFLRWGGNGYTSADLDHGMGTLGVLAADGAKRSLKGICRGAWRIELYGSGVGSYAHDPYNALLAALYASVPGDIALIEAQLLGSGKTPYFPVEYQDHYFQAMRLARALCVLVIEPAGNGDSKLDGLLASAPPTLAAGDPCPIEDSGALVVGAVNPTSHGRMTGSNYGTIVRAFAWGSDVSTLTGDASGTGYTPLYDGTSSASAIVAGAAVVAQALARSALGTTLPPDDLRDLLYNTGTKSVAPATDEIGRMPNLRRVARKLGLHP